MTKETDHSLEDHLETVCDEKTFLSFLNALADDFATDRKILAEDPDHYRWRSGPLGWEHGTIDNFLAAAAACARDPALADAPGNPWRRCAEILYDGKSYE